MWLLQTFKKLDLWHHPIYQWEGNRVYVNSWKYSIIECDKDLLNSDRVLELLEEIEIIDGDEI
jgi:hypothetical protein